MKFKTMFDWKDNERFKEKFTAPSETVPDQAMTIPQLMERYRSGMSIPVNQNMEFEDIPENADLSHYQFAIDDEINDLTNIDAAREALYQIRKINQKAAAKKPVSTEPEPVPDNPEP